MSLDERATVAALDAARSVFHSKTRANQGRVVDTAGDSVLAVFETAAGALNAALQIQAALAEAGIDIPLERRMLYRIGIHSGDVMEKADGSVYGDGVNIAARLQALAEPGQITVSDAIHGAVRGKVSASFTDQGEQQVKNISHPVRAYRVQPEAIGVAPLATRSLPGEIDLSLPDKPSIAVLPFTNMSGDPEQEYFTDGVTEDIITELSRFHSLFVIARNSSFTYKGKPVDVRTVAKELGVRYVLEGSIRRAANRIRVTAQLIDAITGNHIWAEKYDRVLEDIFAVQEELTQGIVVAIAPMIAAAELDKVRRRRPESLTAYEVAIRARACVHDAHTNTDSVLRGQGVELARSALAMDPRSAIALNTLAFAHLCDIIYFTTSDPQASWQQGMASATKAIEVDPQSSEGYAHKALFLQRAIGADRLEEARIALQRARELNPNDVMVLRQQGNTEQWLGNIEASFEPLLLALRISPRSPDRYRAQILVADAHLCLKDYAAALEQANVGLSTAPNFGFLHMDVAMAHAGLGDIEAARNAFATALQLAPEVMASRLEKGMPCRDAKVRQHTRMLLRVAAGLEDPRAADALR
jgi:adenylate cyclase